jgi:AraC family transcriptional regulator
MDTGNTNFNDRIDALIRVIALTLDAEGDGRMLADEACMSRFHFQRTFRRALGETPGALRRRLLLERAAYQIDETARPITEIALDAGYDSLEGFSRAFRRAFQVSPSHFRRIGPRRFRLSCTNGIHYDPRGRGPKRSDPRGAEIMDLTDRLLEHDAWLTRRLLERARALTDEQLDRPLANPQAPVPFEGYDNTLRETLTRLVFAKEVWVAAIRGGQADWNGDNSVDGLLKRMDTTYAEFKEIAREVRDEDKWDATFVDELCCPPETFTYGGIIAHVITFANFRRITALKAMEALGITDLGYGDPIEWERSLVAR